jgi:hypothetical protein
MRARSLSGHGWPVSPRAVAGFFGDRGRVGALLLAYFLWASRESRSLARMASETAQGRESVFVATLKNKDKQTTTTKHSKAKKDQERPHPTLSRKREREKESRLSEARVK